VAEGKRLGDGTRCGFGIGSLTAGLANAEEWAADGKGGLKIGRATAPSPITHSQPSDSAWVTYRTILNEYRM